MSVFEGKLPVKEFKNEYFGPEIPRWIRLAKVREIEETDRYFILKLDAGRHYEAWLRPEYLYISFPLEGGVRIQSLHCLQKKSGMTVPPQNNVGLLEPSGLLDITYEKDGNAVVMTGADNTTVLYEATEGGFVLSVRNAEYEVLRLTDEQFCYHYTGGDGSDCGAVDGVVVEFASQDGEMLCGGGERFNDTDQVGRSFSLTNVDSPASDEYSYTNIPLFHSNKGYSLWFNMTSVGWADFGESYPEKYTFSFDQSDLDLFIWAGDPLENLKKYTAITGTSGVTENWTFGFWTGAASAAFDGTGKKDAFENLKDLLEGFKEHYNFYPEACYGEGKNGTSEQSIKYAAEHGVKMLMWYPPFFNHHKKTADTLPGVPKLPTFDENGNMTDPGYPLPYNTRLFKETGTYEHVLDGIDFTNPNTAIYLKNYFGEYWDWGLAGAMLDMGEKHPYIGTYYNGMTGMEMHNFISYYYAKAHAEAWTKRLGNDYALFLRSGTAGSQKFACNFLGDQWPTWEYFRKIICAMINMGASGYNLYGADLGALLGRPTNDLWNRWVVLAVFSPFMRQHGTVLHMPWCDYGAMAAKTFGYYYYFRKNIVPTLMSAAIDANKTSNPIVKGMMLAYPEQPMPVCAKEQYLFCDDFLVCPVLEEGVWYTPVALPAGAVWYDLYSYKAYEGGQTMMAEAPTSTMPVFVKSGAVKAIDLPQSLVLGAEMHDVSDDVFKAMPALLVTAPDSEKTVTIHVKDGESTDFRTYASHEERYTMQPVADDAFKLISAQSCSRRAILLLGVTATAITVDGLKLAQLDHLPQIAVDEYGYYVDQRGMTTIVLPEGWKQLNIVKGASNYLPLSITSAATQAVDGRADTAYVLRAGDAIQMELENEALLDRVVIKWATGYCSAYTVEYSVDGKDWSLLKAVEDSIGGINAIDTAPTSVKYIRLTPVKVGDAIPAPAIYGVEAYASQSCRISE